MTKKRKLTDIFRYIDMHSGNQLVCWEWRGNVDTRGRPQFSLDGKKHIAYRVVYELTQGVTLTPDVMLLHQCDNKICCNPTHVREGDHKTNMQEMCERERHGMPHHAVRNIKKLLEAGKQTHQQIAELYGCARETVTNIANGRTYSHVKLDDDTPTE